jgi:hypothetical protein
MKKSSLIPTISEFFKDGFAKKTELSLEDLLWYFDYKQRTIPTVQEITGALEIETDVQVKKIGRKVLFVRANQKVEEAEVSLTDEDLERAYKQYNKEFWKLYKQLDQKTHK